MPSVEIPALLTEDIENPDIVDITEPISASITGTGPHTLVIDGQDIHAASSNTIVSGEATITLTSDVNVNAVTTSNLRTPSIHKIKVKTDEKYTFTYVPNSDVTASSVSSTTKTGTDFEILLITTIGGDKYLDLDLVDYTSPVATFSNALTGFNILDLSSFEFGSSAYGVTAKLYKANGTLISTLPSVRAGSIVPFGTGAENTPQSAVDYKLEITDILGRISSYNMTREWNSYVISPIGFQKLTLGNEEITSSPGVLPYVPSLSSARIYPATNQGYIGINFIVQGQNNPSSSWVLVDDTPANVRADGSAEFIMFGNYSYHRIGVKPTAKTTVSVSDYNNVSVTFSDFTDESVTIPSLLTTDPYSIDETTNTYTFVETSNIGVDTPYIVTLGSETYPNAFTATTTTTAVDIVVAFHHGTFTASDYSSAYSTVSAATTAGHVYSNSPSGTYTWGTLLGTTLEPTPLTLGISGLTGWYEADSFNTSTQTWVDLSGNGRNALKITGTVFKNETGLNGRPIIYGGTTTRIDFPSDAIGVVPTSSGYTVYTVFTVAKYGQNQNTSGTKSRIFTSSTNNWLSGFWGGQAGIAYHDNWVTNTTDIHGFNWVISTDQLNLYRSNGTNRTIANGVKGPATLSINPTTPYNETSDWSVAEVILYKNTNLSMADYIKVEEYLNGKYNITTDIQKKTLATGYTWIPPNNIFADVLMVAGGGGGGRRTGGGGGAGGLVFKPSESISSAQQTIVVGNGGTGASSGTSIGTQGANTTFLGYVAYGGGAGSCDAIQTQSSLNGGSGGGAEWNTNAYGVASQPGSSTGGYGNNGGQSNASRIGGAGGGGAGQVGYDSYNSSSYGYGGDGLNEVTINSVTYNFATVFDKATYGEDISGESWFAGGGGGGTYSGSYNLPIGGKGGGGTGANISSGLTAGQAHTGGGGGGDGFNTQNGQNGGSGIVLLKFNSAGSASSDTPSSTLDATTEVSDPILELYFTTAITSFPKNVKRYNISTHDDVLGVLFESFASKRKRVEKMINTNNFSMELTVINVLSPATQYISVANTVSGNKYGTGSGSGLTFGNYTTYSYQTGDQTIDIPSGKTHVKVILKGAGGGYGGTQAGGSGGYTEAEIELPSGTTSLTLIVGQGGDSTVNTSKTYGGGGGSGNDGSVTGGRGGGRTAVRIGGTEIATAGGGGGGCGQGPQIGGYGGGLIALGYSNPNGGGGTQTTGGSGGVGSVNSGQAGAQYDGGTGSYLSNGWGAAGGGGGWYGGGGGGGSGGNHGAGGGGSGFAGRNGSTVLSGNERGTSVAYADTTQRTDSVNGCKYKNVKILRGGGSAGQYSTTSTINHGVAEISWGQNTFEETPTFIFIRGQTYVFDQSDSTNATHPIRLSTTSDGTHASGSQYTSGWTTSGTPGNAGATSQFIVPANASSTLYYYCPNHSGMGGTINIASTPYLLTFGNFTLAANTQVSGEYAIAANYDGTTSNLYMDGDLITQTTPTIASGAKDFILGKEYSGYIKNFTFWNYVKDFSTTPEATPGQQVFTSSGTFTVPTGVTSLSCVVVGGGGGSTGCSGASQYSGAGGGGGGLAYGTFPVSTGAIVTVQVGVGGTAGTNVNNGTNVAGTGGESRITYNGTTIMLRGYGGVGGTYGINTNAAGGGFFISSQATLSGGGNGGYGSRGANNNGGGGGGGAGGYGGTGGNGGYGNGGAGSGGDAGGGGGGGGQSIGGAQYNGGGGVGLEGQGSNGTGNSVNNPGGGGSGGASGGAAGVGGTYGGGAGGCEDDTNRPGSAGGAGGVRIIWGSGRSYPSTNTAAV